MQRKLSKRGSSSSGTRTCTYRVIRFNLFLPLHSLWLGYMSELLALGPAPSALAASSSGHSMPSAASMHAKLVKADFHGSIVTGACPNFGSHYTAPSITDRRPSSPK